MLDRSKNTDTLETDQNRLLAIQMFVRAYLRASTREQDANRARKQIDAFSWCKTLLVRNAIRSLSLLWLGFVIVPATSFHKAWARVTVLQLGAGDNGRALLITPDHQKPKAGIILLAGGDGALDISTDGEIRALRGNQLIRTREDYVRAGYAVLVPDVKVNTAVGIAELRKITNRVAIVATSRGTVRAAQAIAGGVVPDVLVLTAGVLGPNRKWPSVPQIIGNPSRLPPTLIIHHRQDTCFVTLPSEVEPFLAWAGGRAKVIWITGGVNEGDACQAKGFHGFSGKDNEVVRSILGFISSSR